jgi:hypothetical protein
MKARMATIALAAAASLAFAGSPAVSGAAEEADGREREPAVVITADSIAIGTVSNGAFAPGADLRVSVRSVSPRPGATGSLSLRFPAPANCISGLIPNDYGACVDPNQCVWPYEILNGVCTLECSTHGGVVMNGTTCVPVVIGPNPPWPGPGPQQGADNISCMTHPNGCVSKAWPVGWWLGSPTLP